MTAGGAVSVVRRGRLCFTGEVTVGRIWLVLLFKRLLLLSFKLLDVVDDDSVENVRTGGRMPSCDADRGGVRRRGAGRIPPSSADEERCGD